MSAEKKPPLLKWWSEAKGSGDDLTYYNKSRKLTRIVQGLIIAVGILIIAVKAIAFFYFVHPRISHGNTSGRQTVFPE
jgi:hypothetical protein